MGLACKLVCLAVILVIIIQVHSRSGRDGPSCGRATDCGQCMGIDPRCAWCLDDEYDDTKEGPGYRCALSTDLLERGCPVKKIEFVKSSIQSVSQPDPNDPNSADIQLTPRSQSVRVRPNEPLNVSFTFQSISDYPVDLYFLTDLSYTMRDDLETVSQLTNDIVLAMRKVTKKLHMGFGAFVDKPVFPFIVPTKEYLQNPCLNVGNASIQCDPPFLFKHILSLTDEYEAFRKATKFARPSGNLDSPEGGLDALLQVALCGSWINWRTNARKIVLFASDGGFHLAGDGRIAGLIRPPPTTCQVTDEFDRFNSSLKYIGWHTSDQTDYPSVGEIAKVLTEKDISVIFAVDKKLQALYTRLAEFLPSTAVGILSDKSTNIVRLLRENYDKIANKAELTTSYDADSLEVHVLTKCNHETNFTEKSVCNDHPVAGRIEYQISVKPKRCFTGKKTASLKMVALDDQAELQVETACDCPSCISTSPITPKPSERCGYQGYLQCGSCHCNAGYSGDFCECSAATSQGGDEAMLKRCIQDGSVDPCTGRGRCVCGKCKCNLARYEGPYCECDRHGCKRASDDNQVCGGPQRGECLCNGTCKCKPGYTGDRCDCMQSEVQCYDPKDASGPPCSGRGICDCGQCFCNSGFTGYLCNEQQGGASALCTDRDVEKCVLCIRDAWEELSKDKEDDSNGGGTKTTPSTTAPLAPTYALAEADSCAAECNHTVIDMNRVKMVTSSEETDGAKLCIIYTKDHCRVFFTYRYSDAIYLHRKVIVDIMGNKQCAPVVNIIYIVLGVVASIVLGGIILLLIYKLVITIDDRRELAKFEKQGENIRWELAENPIFQSPTTKVLNPTFEDNGY